VEGKMTATVKEELAKVSSLCEETLAEQSSFEESLARDFKAIERLLKQFEGSKGNHPITAEEARALALHVRQAIDGNQVNAQGTHILLLLLLQVSLLAQQNVDMKVEIPTEIQKTLGMWMEHWEAAKTAWNKYTQ
jgi:hypothetical protein